MAPSGAASFSALICFSVIAVQNLQVIVAHMRQVDG